MAENRSPDKPTVADPPSGTRPRAIGMYERPEKTNRLSPMLLIGIVVLILLLVLAFYFVRF